MNSWIRLTTSSLSYPRHRPLFYFLGLSFILIGFYHHFIAPTSVVTLDEVFDTAAPQLPDKVWDERAAQVRKAFEHAYHGYERYAMPHDELKPLLDRPIDNFNGWGVTLVDSLDTMLLMGLNDEFTRALAVVEKADFALPKNQFAPFFETVIRYLGGLLSAYALSNNTVLLQRADDLAVKLDTVFNTTSGFPFFAVNTVTGFTRGPQLGILAEIASLQMEYTYLAKATGKIQHARRAGKIIKALSKANLDMTGGMFPVRWNISSSEPYGSHMSVGAQADSAHEYLLKQYLLSGRTDKVNLEMYLRTTTYIITQLMFISPNRHLVYVTGRDDSKSGKPGLPSQVLEHLSCFLPGLLALGVHTLPLDDLESLGIDFASLHSGRLSEDGLKAISGYSLKDLHLWAAQSLAETCWLTYADQPTGLGPEEVVFTSSWQAKKDTLWIDAMNRWKKSGARGAPPGLGKKTPILYTEEERLRGGGKGRDYAVKKPGYLLRPETVESLYLLWRVTGDHRWRERGWRIFEAIEREAKTKSGYASLRTVAIKPSYQDDSMPRNDDPIPLDKWVFNTEAHPLPVFEWSAEERHELAIYF
ncbi:hypothetical protein CCMSSC00406_0003911 [Pleurotus cornucopiae]|uniref:Uncharacterized protein n=1 Tax=Pleurotus cornucopiae TaxID=5321 RepID=A0ACB7IRX1_PLECO|nr:hypothetical protein CCMSSC00406_0003911 [Pleurotus cornucopiae]